jgi:hypothetical protein
MSTKRDRILKKQRQVRQAERREAKQADRRTWEQKAQDRDRLAEVSGDGEGAGP